MTIEIDITGFYYRNSIDAESIVTVADAMKKAAAGPAPNGGLLTVTDDANGFVNSITVVYPSAASPQSGQGLGARPKGIYGFNDDPLTGNNAVPGTGNINGQLVWQYYVERGGAVLNNDRKIYAYTESDSAPMVGALEDGDKIIWRLVAIFGLQEMMQGKEDALVDMVAKGNPNMSMKSAIRSLSS